jgi:nucleoside-diphosphate-sugar epimerase
MVQGLILAMDSDRAVGQSFNIGHDEPLTQAQYLALIAEEMNVRAPWVRVPYAPLYAAAYLAERVAKASGNRISPFLTRHGVKLYGADNRMSIDKARRELGYAPRVSVRDAVIAACRWREHSGAATLSASIATAGATAGEATSRW